MSPSPPTRILYVIDHAVATGGAERFAVALAARLPRERFEPWMCITRFSDAPTRRLLGEAGVPHVVLGRTTRWDVHRLGGLARLLAGHRFEIIHAHMFGSSLWASLLGGAARVPSIIAQEHGSAFDSRRRAWIDGQIIGRAVARYVAVSRTDAALMVSRHRVPAEKIVVIPNGYIPRPASRSSDIRAELGIEADAPLVGVAAVLRPEKRIDVLLEAFARVRTTLPRARLVIAGTGPCREALTRRAEELGLDGSAHFIGVRRDVDAILTAADVSALTSDREASPLLMFECMANGTPLVATAVGGIAEVVQDGRSGLLVPRRDPGGIAAGLVRVLSDRGLAARLADGGRERLAAFTIDAAVARYVELYDSLTDARDTQ